MNVKELKKLLANLADNTEVLLVQEGIYRNVLGDATEVVPDSTQAGYARVRAQYRTAESDDVNTITVFCFFADD